MIDQNILEKFYSKIFSVPKKRVSIAIGVTSIILASYLNGISGKSFFAMRYFFIGLALIAILIIFGRIVGSGFNSRRIFFLALFFLILIEIGDIIAIHFLSPELIMVTPSAIAFVLTVALFFTSERFNFAYPFLTLVLLHPVDFYFSFNAPHRTVAYIIASLSGILLGYLFIRFLKKRAGNIVVADILKDFVLYWLKGDPGIFERRLKLYSKVSSGNVYLMKLGRCSVFVPEFHPGPFRDVGGAVLVRKALEKYDLFLHGVSEHSKNPVTGEDVDAIVNVQPDLNICNAFKPYTVEGEKFWIKVYPFESFSIIIIHGKERLDDLPSQIREYAETFFRNPVVVDAHSAYEERYVISSSDMAEIYSLIGEAGKIRSEKVQNFKTYHSSIDYENERICGKIGMILMDYDGERHAILMVDSNNMKVELRDWIVRYGKRYGVDIDVITTDNHSKTGVSPKIGYEPADMRDVDVIEEFLKGTLNSRTESSQVQFGWKNVAVMVMGDGFFKDIDLAFRKYGERGIYLFGIFSCFNYLTTFLLATLII